MNRPDVNEVNFKIDKVRKYLEANNYDAMIIGRQDNFAWITDGGDNRVIISTEYGFGVIVVTKDKKYLVAQVMDGSRIMEDELAGLDFEYVPLRWYEQSREEKAVELVMGGRIISDMPIKGTEFLPREFFKLQYPLTQKEIEKLRWLGAKTEEIIAKVAAEVRPGMTEYEVAAMFLYEYGRYNIYQDVLLIGSDERISKYRHPNPSDKKIDKYVLLHPAVKKWGLHANVTRLVYFGDRVPAEISTKYDAVSTIEAAVISMCTTGTRFSDILDEQKRLYKELGFEEEWRYHYQGGVTGYVVGDASLCLNPENVVLPNQAYDWFITITGVKVEELTIGNGSSQEVVSVSGNWPVKEYNYKDKKISLPDILLK
ncbi:MAG: M24 family metallopeptidase [Clostridia bacterium]|nr:M24 family metallopeptidase [Clostridia bacterium]